MPIAEEILIEIIQGTQSVIIPHDADDDDNDDDDDADDGDDDGGDDDDDGDGDVDGGCDNNNSFCLKFFCCPCLNFDSGSGIVIYSML